LQKYIKPFTIGLAVVGCIGNISPKLLASNDVITGSVRVQMLSSSLVRLELAGAEGFEDRTTFHVVDRNWPGTSYSSNVIAGQVIIASSEYTVHVPQNATSLAGSYVTSPSGQTLYKFDGTLNNSVWLPGPAANPTVLSFADTPRLIPPAWGLTPAPGDSQCASTSGWDTNNDAPDVYVFVPNGSYSRMRSDFLKLTGPTEMIPLYALGAFDSHWYDYSETGALAQIENYRHHSIPLDNLVCDTGWRQGASTGYRPNKHLFPNLPRFLSEAHVDNVRVMFNDHPEPVASNALDSTEITYRFTNLTRILEEGLNIWWYDRNWPISLLSPAPNLRHEVWAMKVYHDATREANPRLRPMIMANVDGIDNGIRHRPMDVNAHTYPIQWTGDIQPTMTYLNYAVKNAVHSGVACLFPYESDDIGGFINDPSPSDYIRWIEYGTLSPVYRPHANFDLNRMPWTLGAEAEWTARRFVNLRYRLLPVFYAAARNNYDTGEPILRRLDLDYPQYPGAAQENQYLIGHSLLVAPVAQEGLAPVPPAWLTRVNGGRGLDAEYFPNRNLAGSPAFVKVDQNVNFNWHSGSPGRSVPANSWGAQWTGNITVPAAVGDVTLAACSDDGVRVWVDGQLCIGNWGANNSVTTESATMLKAGLTHQLKVQYLQLGANDLISLEWRGASASQSQWIPPGNWINAWTGDVLSGPATIIGSTPLDETPLYIRSGSVFALAPQMQYTGQLPWDPITLDVYPNPTESDQTSLYEDDTLTTAYKQGQYRTTLITTWSDDADKKVSVLIGAAKSGFSGASTQRSWVVRLHRAVNWSTDLIPTHVTLNGQTISPIVRRVKNTTAMPLGADNGAPDADVFEVSLPESSVTSSNLIVATFTSIISPWICGDVGDTGANGSVFGGASTLADSICTLRGEGAGIEGTNDGFHYLYQPCLSNVELTVHFQGQNSSNTGAESGVMISETLDPSSPNAVIGYKAGLGLVFQSRSIVGTVSQSEKITDYSPPCWLRLQRVGSRFIGYASNNGGAEWMQIGSATIPGFSPQAYIGLVSTTERRTNSDLIGVTNSTGTRIVGVSPEMLNGVYGVDDTNYNLAAFDNLAVAAQSALPKALDRWTPEQAETWYNSHPWLVGANFVPSTAINQLEMWQVDSFDPTTIDRELGYAQSIGMNTMRVFLHDLAWREDPEGFYSRIDKYLAIADRHGIKSLFVIFDGVWNPYPKPGKQPDPVPGRHNSGWVQSPGRDYLENSAKQDDLKPYVIGLLTRYKNDPRVLAWDLFNEPDNPNRQAYGQNGNKTELSEPDKARFATQLLRKEFVWAQEVRPSQPLTAGVWLGDYLSHPTDIQKLCLDESDVISFHCYDGPREMRERLEGLTTLGRPILCTEYMARGNNSTFQGVLPLLKKYNVAAYNWGLVNGKSQTIYPWDSWVKDYTNEPAIWFHDVFRADGTPFSTAEVRLIRDLSERGKSMNGEKVSKRAGLIDVQQASAGGN
jgi:alpha-glucosidase (family GH31 glycosyl hydrolase)